ncbi:MAG TPA: hypothetical protein VMF14_12965 [Solirubrobacteraceae bacterium]|nr:hypothetical protein [Solirubrobacteraceae bacterium]
MTTPSSSSRILLLADRRVPASSGGVRIQRYRLARVPRGARAGETARRLGSAKTI